MRRKLYISLHSVRRGLRDVRGVVENSGSMIEDDWWKRLAGPTGLLACKGSFDCGCASLSRSTILAQDDSAKKRL